MAETPPRLSIACRSPPPLERHRSRRKRKISRKFDLPEAFGPIKNRRRLSFTSPLEKFFQFSILNLRMYISLFHLQIYCQVYFITFHSNPPCCCGKVENRAPNPRRSLPARIGRRPLLPARNDKRPGLARTPAWLCDRA